jgi:hypothetical protein
MSRRIRPFLVCAALGAISMAATSAFATGEPPKVQLREVPAEGTAASRVAPITVEATQPNELRKQTFGFVQTFAATSVKLDQVARWNQSVCVTVKGLPADASEEVRARVIEVASALKLKTEKPGCPPNIQVMFTSDPQRLIDKVANTDERLLGYWHHKDRAKLKAITHPIQAWYVTGTAGGGADTAGLMFMTVETYAPSGASTPGVAIPAASSAVASAAGRQPHGVRIDDEDDPRGPTGCGDNSHFTACLSSEFQHVLVIVDTSKVGAYPPGLIADYVVMVALAQPRSLDGCNILPSVLDLFSKDCPGRNGQDGLSRADVAYLTALYKMDLQGKKGAQMSDMAGRMSDMLIKANKADQLTIQAATGSAKR